MVKPDCQGSVFSQLNSILGGFMSGKVILLGYFFLLWVLGDSCHAVALKKYLMLVRVLSCSKKRYQRNNNSYRIQRNQRMLRWKNCTFFKLSHLGQPRILETLAGCRTKVLFASYRLLISCLINFYCFFQPII